MDEVTATATATTTADPKPHQHGLDRRAGRKVRVPLSCGPCRSRKLKCNREKPCQNCIVREHISACTFIGPNNRNAPAISHVHMENMQSRIDRLEDLVKSLTAQKRDETDPSHYGDDMPSQDKSPAYSTTLQTSNTLDPELLLSNNLSKGQGMMKVDDDHSFYIGPSHWSDVLHELNQLKSSWTQVQKEQDAINLSTYFGSINVDGPSLLCGLVKPIGMPELLATIPTRHAADKLIARFFNDLECPVPSLYILHRPTFLKQYEDHWKHPSGTKVMWLGLLFSILSISMLSYSQSNDEPPEYEGISKSLSELYCLRTAQCLMMADITKCLPYTLETLIYNALAEGACKKVSPAGVWIMGGVIIRVALQMGYHRDSSHYPNITVFQGEMRRRIWHVLLTSEAISSFVVGLPNMIRTVDHDTAEPRNIHDSELDEGMVELPSSRPISEETSVSYLITKSRLLRPLGLVVDFVSSVRSDSYEEALHVDDQLTRAHSQVPPHLRMRNLELRAGDPPAVVNRMIQIEFLYHQGVCVLHRRFLVQGRFDSRFARSREQCIKSAMALLNHQAILYQLAKRTNTMMATYWFRVTPISQDFVLPAVILCLDLRYRGKGPGKSKIPMRWTEDNEQEAMLGALHTANKIWSEVRDISLETWKIFQVLSQLFEALGIDGKDDSSITGNVTPPSSAVKDGFAAENSVPTMDRDNSSSFADMDIDWLALDSFLEGSSFEDAYGAMQFSGDSLDNFETNNAFEED